jgi:hypothetical protein
MVIIMEVVHRHKFFQTRCFGIRICFRHQVVGEEVSHQGLTP